MTVDLELTPKQKRPAGELPCRVRNPEALGDRRLDVDELEFGQLDAARRARRPKRPKPLMPILMGVVVTRSP